MVKQIDPRMIEVTDAMIEAGVESLRWQQGPPKSDERQMVKGIYRAMNAVSQPPADVDDLIIETINVVTDLHDADALDRAYSEVLSRFERFAALNTLPGQAALTQGDR